MYLLDEWRDQSCCCLKRQLSHRVCFWPYRPAASLTLRIVYLLYTGLNLLVPTRLLPERLKLQQVACRCTGPVSRAPSGSSPTWLGAASAVLCVMQTKPSFYAACARANFLTESGRGFSDNPACGFLTMPDEFLPRVIKWIYNCGFVVVEQKEHIYRYFDFIIQVRSCDFNYA